MPKNVPTEKEISVNEKTVAGKVDTAQDTTRTPENGSTKMCWEKRRPR